MDTVENEVRRENVRAEKKRVVITQKTIRIIIIEHIERTLRTHDQ